jgi:twitching motility protein PilT
MPKEIASMEQLLRHMYDKSASDLILTESVSPQLRIKGRWESTDFETLKPHKIKDLAYSILNKTQIENFEQNKDIGFSYALENLCRFRINCYIQRNTVAVAVRLIRFDIPTFEELSLPGIIKDFASRAHGLFITSGPVGCGKSTTLAAMVDYINQTRRAHIICIEDPIEYVHKNKSSVIDQREVGEDAVSFESALRNVFRQNPDVIMIGEMRDRETMQLALTLAETGHLILTTLHTQDAASAVNRIIDVFPASQQDQVRVQLSMSLIGVVVQRLIQNTEMTGLVLACEIMNVNDAIKSLIRDNQPQQIYSVIQTGKADGMASINNTLEELFKSGKITLEDAIAHSSRPKELLKRVGGGAYKYDKK